MKPAAWVADVVKAYRLVLDAESPEEERKALVDAKELLARAPSRRLSSGHLDETGAGKILAPHLSGSSGAWAGTVKSVSRDRVLIDLRSSIAKGDRFRPESSTGRQEDAFTVSHIFNEAGKIIFSAQPGEQIYLVCSKPLRPGDRLFKVGTKSEPASAIWKKIREQAPRGRGLRSKFPDRQLILDNLQRPADAQAKPDETLILKVNSADGLVQALKSSAAMVLVSATRNNLERIARQKFSPFQMKKLGFSLPALIAERDIEYFRAAVAWFINRGFLLWEINNWGHFDLAGQGRAGDLRLVAGSRLNLRNGAAFAQARELGCKWSVLSLETTGEELEELAQKRFTPAMVVTVYCWPPLFTSRLFPAIQKGRPFHQAVPPPAAASRSVDPGRRSNRPGNPAPTQHRARAQAAPIPAVALRHRQSREVYHLEEKAGRAKIFADQPVSWLEQLPVLRSLGYANFLMDLSEGPQKQLLSVEAALAGFAASRSPADYSLFNLERRP